MTVEIERTTGYARLDWYAGLIVQKLDETVTTVRDYMQSYFNIAKEEGIPEGDAKKYLKSKLPNSTFYKYLPVEIERKQTKPKKIPPVESNPKCSTEFNTEGMGVVIDESESASESTTGSGGQEVEQEVEVVPIPTIDAKSETQEYEEIIADKDRVINDLRRQNKALEDRNNKGIPDLEGRIQIQNLEQKNKALQIEIEDLRRNQRPPEIVKASELPSVVEPAPDPGPLPFVITKEEKSSLWKFLGRTMGVDTQAFLVNDPELGRFMYYLIPYGTTGVAETDLQKARAQAFLEQTRNATR